MSERTSTVVSTQAETQARDQLRVAASQVPWISTVDPDGWAWLLADCASVLGDGVPMAEYVECLAGFTGLAEYRAQCDGKPEVQAEAAEAEAEARAEVAKATAEQVAEKAATAEEAEAAARAEAAKTLTATVAAFRKGEKAYRAGLLEAGRLASVYIGQRLALNDVRKVAVTAIEGRLSEYSSSTVDVNALVRAYWAYKLLAEVPGVKADAVPYGHYREAWTQLVERMAGEVCEEVGEVYRLLPGLEDECRTAFAKAVREGVSRDGCLLAVRAIQRKHADNQAKALAAEEEAAKKAQKAAEAAKKAAAAEAEKAEQAARDAKAAADTAKAEERAEATAKAEAAKEELLAKQRAAAVANAEAVAQQAAAARAEADRKAAAEAAAKAADKEAKATAKAADKEAGKATKATKASTKTADAGKPDASGPAGIKPAQLVAKATAKDAAELLAKAVEGHTEPDTLVELLLERLAKSTELCHASKHAIQAALVLLKRPQQTSRQTTEATAPVAVAQQLATAKLAERNGHVAVA